MVCAAALWLGGGASSPSHQWFAYVAFIDNDRRIITRTPPYACGMRRPRRRTTNSGGNTHTRPTPDAEPNWEGSEQLKNNALTLVARNQICGRINGQRLRDRAPAAGNNDEVPIEIVALRIASAHNDEKCAKRPSEQFRQLRQATFLCVGAPVMLMQNFFRQCRWA